MFAFCFILATLFLCGQSQVNCSAYTDCVSCTAVNCTFCEFPTVNSNFVCHSSWDIENPCSFFCPQMNVRSPSSCIPPVKNLYDATIATEMLYLSTSAYAQNQQTCLSKLPVLSQNSWAKYGDFSNSQCDIANSTCFGFTAVSQKRNAIAVVFRGTSDLTQLVLEFVEAFLPSAPWPYGGQVAPYFLRAHMLLYPQIKKQLVSLIKLYPSYTLYITGHSLGAALGSLLASAVVGDRVALRSPVLYTFGQPRVGDAVFSSTFNSIVPNGWRVIHYIDPVPHIPLCSEFLVNGPTPVCSACPIFDGIFSYHHGTEVWYNISGSNFSSSDDHTVCNIGWPLNEVVACSNGFVDYGQLCFGNFTACLQYHTYYFGVSLSDCGASDCSNRNLCNY